MMRDRKILTGKIVSVLGVIPALIYAYASGPEPRKTGAPGEGLCTECHAGTANSGGGSVVVRFPADLTYAPGVKQRLTVVVTDSTARVFGYQMTARLASNERNGQAGTFAAADAATEVICEDGSDRDSRTQNPTGSCKTTAPVEFSQHKAAGAANTFLVDWTPPASDVGEVKLYVAGNAANGNGQNTGDRIYTASYTLKPAAAGGAKPAIRSQQPVLQAFSGMPGLSPGTWIEIYGANLSSASRAWKGEDFRGNQAPAELDGVKVTVAGKPAFISYISPTQVNAQAPDDIGTGPVPVVVTTAAGASDPAMVTAAKVSPALLTTPLFNVDGRQYVAALHADGVFVGRPNLIAGAAFRPAKPGDVIIVYAVGCGPTNPASPAGQFFPEARPLSLPFQIRVGEVVAQSAGNLAAQAVGLCQFNVTIPQNTADGDVRLDAAIDGIATGQTLYTTIQR